MQILDLIALWIHLFSAIIFVGGSFFIWLVAWPESFKIAENETQRTRIIGRMTKRFAFFTNVTVITLVVTGAYLAVGYLGSSNLLFRTLGGRILFVKIITVIVMIALMYGNNLYHGKKIMRLLNEGKLEEVRKTRRLTHAASFVTLGLLVLTTILAVALQIY
jgi:putative copper resistance protein D